MKTLIAVSCSALLLTACALAQMTPEVTLTVESASPRSVESLTEHSILRDYTAAWQSLATASENSAPGRLDAYFVGTARSNLSKELSDQKTTGAHVRYLNQQHRLKAVFYAPEGDVMELEDDAEYQMQVVSDDKVIHDEHIAMKYVVLMTPASDRWVVRQLQAVPNF